MKLTFLGTATEPKPDKLAACLWVEACGKSILVDAPPGVIDALPSEPDVLLLTHYHFGCRGGLKEFLRRFPNALVMHGDRFHCGDREDGLTVDPVELDHARCTTYGYKFSKSGRVFLYAPHFRAIDEMELEGLDLAILDGTTLDKRLDVHMPMIRSAAKARRAGVGRVLYTALDGQIVPEGATAAYPGMTVDFEEKDVEGEKLAWEDLTWAHHLVLEECSRRGGVLRHHVHDALDRGSANVRQKRFAFKPGGDTVLIKDFVWAVGSAVENPEESEDVDVLFRAERGDDGFFRLQAEGAELAVRKMLALDKECKLHYMAHAQGPHQGTALPLADLVMRGHRDPKPIKIKAASIKPSKRYQPMKPSMAGTTEFFDIDELWEKWAEEKIKKGPLYGSSKIDGFRTSISHSGGGKLDIWFEDSKERREFDLKVAEKRPFVIEGEFTAKKGDKWLARTELAGVAAGKIEATPHFWLYELLYCDEDMHEQPFLERLKTLKSLDLPKANFTVLEQREVKSKADLEKVGKWAASQPLSEGLYIRQDAPYQFGATNMAAKVKTTLREFKVAVLEVIKRENGYTYHCGLREPDDFANTVEFRDKQFVDLGNTFVVKEKLADEGDTLNVEIEELIIGDHKLAWGKPMPLDVDKSRPAYTAAQAIDLARRGKVLKEEVGEAQKALREVPTRAEASAKFWKENWWKMFPKSGKGQFTYQHHWRGLSEEEIRLDEAALLKTDHSLHGDLRLTAAAGDLWGFSVFTGTADKVREAGGCRLCDLPPDDNLQGSFKLEEPKAWLTVARNNPYVSEPLEAGATAQKYAKFFEVDHGDYSIGVWREHMFELFFHGRKMKGRFLIQYAPLGGRRIWIIDKPEDQTPYAESRDLEDVLKELKGKGQKHLVWAKPGEKPVLYDTGTGEAVKMEKIEEDDKTLNERQAEGDSDQCLCPDCGHRTERESDNPCAETKCPDCGAAMKTEEPEEETAGAALDAVLSRFMAGQLGAQIKELSENPAETANVFKIFKAKDEKYGWISVTSNAYEDLDEETITAGAMDFSIKLSERIGDKGELRWEHIPSSRLGECTFQKRVGNFLLEAGEFDGTKRAEKAIAALEKAPPGKYRVSPGFRWFPAAKRESTFYAVHIFERSVTTKPANPWTSIELIRSRGEDMFKLEIRDELVKTFGEEEVLKMEEQLEEAQKSLGSHIAFKSDEDREATFKLLADLVVEAAKAKNPKKDEEEEKYPKPKKPEEEEKATPANLALGKIAKLVEKDDSPLAKKIMNVLKAAGVKVGEGYGYPAPKKKSLADIETEIELRDRMSALEESIAQLGIALPQVFKALADRKSQTAEEMMEKLLPLVQQEGEESAGGRVPLSEDELKEFKAWKQRQKELAEKAGSDEFRRQFDSARMGR